MNDAVQNNEIVSKEWYVIHAYSGHEKQVKRTLEDHIDSADMQDCFEEILVPSEEVVEIRNGKKRISTRQFFPGYIFVKMTMNEETWHLVRHSPKVLGFIGGTAYPPTAVEEEKIEQILLRVKEGEDNPRPKNTYQASEVVRVIDGPFKEFEAVVENVHYDKNRLDVSVIILGRSTRVTLDFNQVQKS